MWKSHLNQKMADRERKKRSWMVQWDREADNNATTLPLGTVRSDNDNRREMDIYAQLEFMKLAALVRCNSENKRPDSNDDPSRTFICLNIGKGLKLTHQRLLVGSLTLNILLLTVCVSLLLLYLKVDVKVSRDLEEELRMNQSYLSEFLQEEKELSNVLHTNLSSLWQEHTFLRENTLSLLLYNQTQHLQAIENLEQGLKVINENFSLLEEQYTYLKENHLLVPRKSILLENCKQGDLKIASMVCPYCSPGWQLFNMSCYLLSSSALSWQESMQWCRRKGAHLAVINNAEKQYFMLGLVKKTSWIGLSDRDLEGDWRWVDGTPYDKTTTFWSLKQPNNAGNEDCVTLSPGTGWNDDKCFKAYNIVCEHNAYQLSLNGDMLSN
ncbi:C-type lectin domain family 10 member A-like [Pelobates fuscus]|uniref:C-type lectin domain family 10 member A-like n=1 Tax=Pelobates fuscus TaxID=191477 RepID=UPI002FE46335